jgi:hypothetical protein
MTEIFFQKYRIPTMLKLQYHLIGRSDDICTLETNGFRGPPDPRFCRIALVCKVIWSKAVYDERTCPDQILLGSMDTQFCFLSSFSIYIEESMSNDPGHHCKYIFCNDVTCNDADEHPVEGVKNNYQSNLRENVFKAEDFKKLSPDGLEGLGSHSLRKFASTWAVQNGCTYLDVETRDRWKTNSHEIVAGRYVDGKVESYLYVGGPITYKLIADCGCNIDW